VGHSPMIGSTVFFFVYSTIAYGKRYFISQSVLIRCPPSYHVIQTHLNNHTVLPLPPMHLVLLQRCGMNLWKYPITTGNVEQQALIVYESFHI